MSQPKQTLPQFRFDLVEATAILRMSRATLYERSRQGAITSQKDGRRSYITAAELERYVAQLG